MVLSLGRAMACVLFYGLLSSNASSLVWADGPDGFATVGGEVTGGAGGQEVVVTTGEELQKYADSKEPYIIYVKGTVNVNAMDTHVRPNKTILGVGADATIAGGGLYLHRSNNVIVRNLTIRDSSDDGIGLLQSTNVWIDHCTFLDCADGNFDMRRASDNVTVSWCKFEYTKPTDHALASLLGSNDNEVVNEGKLHTTYHHNWFATGVKERMPSVRFGTVHIYNNYYSSRDNNYCVRIRLSAQALIENNSFDGVKNPWEVYVTNAAHKLGKIRARDNLERNVKWGKSDEGSATATKIVPGNDDVFTPPYEYLAEPSGNIKNAVTEGAGAGKLNIAEPGAAAS